MQNLQQNITTLFDPDLKSQTELFGFTERLIGGLPGRNGNTLLLLKLGVPTPSAGLALPSALRERIGADLHPNLGPGKDFPGSGSPGKNFIRHVRPRGDDDVGPDGPVYRICISELPVPQKHEVQERTGPGGRRLTPLKAGNDAKHT